MVTRYEELRRHALGVGEAGGPMLGLGLFLGQGMACWLEGWKQHARMAAPERRDIVCAGVTRGPGLCQEVVEVLTAMAMGNLQEVPG